MTAEAAESDADLVRAAQAGNVDSLGLVLARHQAPMRAVAIGILGYRPEADDAVQEAALIALRRIGDVRQPAAIGAWLRTLVRNVCRMQIRRRDAVPVPDVEVLAARSTAPDPAELLEQHVSRDWIWTAVGELSPKLRLPTLLRYFTDVTSYDEIATACDIPVGTVRSRLNQARAKLSAALLATADSAYDDVAGLTESRRHDAQDILDAGQHGDFAKALAGYVSPHIETTWPGGSTTDGPGPMVAAMDLDRTDGVRHELVNVVASRNLTIWEVDLVSPPDDPEHCPPGVVWLNSLEGGRVRRLRLAHRPRNDTGLRSNSGRPDRILSA